MQGKRSLHVQLLLLVCALVICHYGRQVSGFRLVAVAARRHKAVLKLHDSEPTTDNAVPTTEASRRTTIPKPNIITPAMGSQYPQLEKFLMMYTCKICTGRNAQMISKVAYNHGMVVSTCRHCKSKHLIADNEGKLDMKEYGKKIEDYLQQKNERVQRITITPKDLEDNYLVDTDGVISLVSKNAGQPPTNVNIIDMPTPGAPLPPIPPKTGSGGGGGGGFKTERIVNP